MKRLITLKNVIQCQVAFPSATGYTASLIVIIMIKVINYSAFTFYPKSG